MEQLRKVVTVSCLTYALYGLISWLQLGKFLPPLPVKSFIFLLFFIFGIIHSVRLGFTYLSVIFFIWLSLLITLNQSFLELFFNTAAIIQFQVRFEVYLQLLQVILFFALNSFIIYRLVRITKIAAFYFLILILITLAIFIIPQYVLPRDGVIILGVLYFLTERFASKDLNIETQGVLTLIYGISFIEFIERIVLM